MKQADDKNPNGQESILELRVLLVGSKPEIWRQLEVRGSTSLDQVHGVLQMAFGWEDAHLHRFTDSDPFAPLRLIDGEIPEALQWLPAQWCEEPADRAEEDCSLDRLLASGSGSRSMSTISATAGFTGSTWFPAAQRRRLLRRRG